jgi:hypothetical protein
MLVPAALLPRRKEMRMIFLWRNSVVDVRLLQLQALPKKHDIQRKAMVVVLLRKQC